jgi:DNA-binding response OmpR family regulator
MTTEPPTVLIVEDEPDLADLYATWLGDEYEVRTAYGGHEALEQLDGDVDVVLLDRRMPDMPGDEVLTAIRDDGENCRVAMVTAVEPDFDIIAMGFDDYLVKPVTKDDIYSTVSNLLRRDEYETGVSELFALASKKALLESEKSPAELDANEEYQELTERLDDLRERVDTTLSEIDAESDLSHLYRDLGRESDE